MRTEHRYSKGWAWPRDVREWVLERTHGRVLNICSGSSRIGDVQIDADPLVEPDIVADMDSLPIQPRSFDTVVSDPPWNMDYFERQNPFYEAIRAVKPGGTLIYNCPWRPKSSWVTLEDSYQRIDDDWCEVSVVWNFTRVRHESAAEVDW